jgi:hypothetical protein
VGTVPGTPFPDAQHGEVHAPSGARAYLAVTASAIARRTERWATKLAAGGVVEAEQAHIPGKRGGKAWFLLADDFEALGAREGWWPPENGSTRPWEELFRLQGLDLESVRRELGEVRARCEMLDSANARLLSERDQLLDQIAALAVLAKSR